MWDKNGWLIQSGWDAASFVTARAYRLQAAVLATPGASLQRPAAYWEARKVAIYITVLATDCTYAALARVIGMHRDTVTGHCAQMRELVITDPMLARRINVLEDQARARLQAERISALVDMADLAEAWPAELPETPAQADKRYALIARAREIATLARANPTGICAQNRGHGNVIESFPGAAE